MSKIKVSYEFTLDSDDIEGFDDMSNEDKCNAIEEETYSKVKKAWPRMILIREYDEDIVLSEQQQG